MTNTSVFFTKLLHLSGKTKSSQCFISSQKYKSAKIKKLKRNIFGDPLCPGCQPTEKTRSSLEKTKGSLESLQS